MKPFIIGPNLQQFSANKSYNANLAAWIRSEVLYLLPYLDTLASSKLAFKFHGERSISEEFAHIESYLDPRRGTSDTDLAMHTAYHLGKISLMVKVFGPMDVARGSGSMFVALPHEGSPVSFTPTRRGK